MKLASYRCTLNELASPKQTLALPLASTEFPNWEIYLPDPHMAKFVRALGKVPRAQAAFGAKIGVTGNQGKAYGPEWVFINGHEHANELDGFHYKKTVFVGAEIGYDGGPVILEEVYFVNCTFRVSRSLRGSKLLMAVINKPPTTIAER